MKGSARLPLPYLIVTLQLVTSLVVAAGFALADKSQESAAALLAGAVCVVPAGYFAWRSQRERLAGRLLGQGLMKSVLTLSLMALVFAAYQPAALGFFSAFVLIQAMYVIGPLLFGTTER